MRQSNEERHACRLRLRPPCPSPSCLVFRLSASHLTRNLENDFASSIAAERIGLYKMGDPDMHAHMGINSVPIQMAVKFGVPLVIWGERDPALGTFLLDGIERFAPLVQIHTASPSTGSALRTAPIAIFSDSCIRRSNPGSPCGSDPSPGGHLVAKRSESFEPRP